MCVYMYTYIYIELHIYPIHPGHEGNCQNCPPESIQKLLSRYYTLQSHDISRLRIANRQQVRGKAACCIGVVRLPTKAGVFRHMPGAAKCYYPRPLCLERGSVILTAVLPKLAKVIDLIAPKFEEHLSSVFGETLVFRWYMPPNVSTREGTVFLLLRYRKASLHSESGLLQE